MPQSCDPKDLSKASSCFQCLDAKQLSMVQTYELAVIAGVSIDPEELVAAAAQFQALSQQQLSMVQVYLLCQILGG